MNHSSLVPERQLVFSPALAATIGLEEAVMLQHLQQRFDHDPGQLRDGYCWLRVERQWLEQTLPFWNPVDLHRITKSLADKGLIFLDSPPLHSGDHLLFAINERTVEPGQETGAHRHDPLELHPSSQGSPQRHGASLLSATWTPGEDMLQLLALNQGVPRQFAIDQLEDFVLYWRERGEISHAWEHKFRQHVINRWRNEQRGKAESPFLQDQPQQLDNSWRPSADAMEILLRADVARDFIDDAVPEFVLYWRERGESPKALNSKFVQHIRTQWARLTSSRQPDAVPAPIATTWRPDNDVFDILRMSHIDEGFALQQLPEFIVYWRDDGRAHTSWNTKFLQHVKYQWARRHKMNQSGQDNEGQPGHRSASSTRGRSLEADLSDRSWAD